jgi:hypothetical protein
MKAIEFVIFWHFRVIVYRIYVSSAVAKRVNNRLRSELLVTTGQDQALAVWVSCFLAWSLGYGPKSGPVVLHLASAVDIQ